MQYNSSYAKLKLNAVNLVMSLSLQCFFLENITTFGWRIATEIGHSF